MAAYSEILNAARRLLLLQILAESTAYTSNEHTLGALAAEVGHGVSAGRLCADLRWLEERTLLQVKDVGGVMVATLTQDGQDAAQGRLRVAGVDAPRPPMPQ